MQQYDRWNLMHHASLGSTQSEARRVVDAADQPVHRVVVTADEQTAGVGRRGATFHSPPGGAYQTLVLHEPSLGWDVTPSLAVGMAYELAVRIRDEGFDGRIKWPNDVYVGELKAAGILTERHAGHLLIGIGLNALNDPPPGATRLNRPPDEVRRWVQDAWDALDRADGHWQSRREEVPHVLGGKRVRVSKTVGSVRQIAADGRLELVKPGGDAVFVSAGHVELLPPSGS